MRDAQDGYPPDGAGMPEDLDVGEGDAGFRVTLPSGATVVVLTAEEVGYLTSRIERYEEDNKFVNISDLQDLDRLLMLELFVFRWQYWLSAGANYVGGPVNEQTLQRHIKEFSTEIRQLKEMLGVDKRSRDRAKGEDNVADFLTNLLLRAHEFGIFRDEQCAKIIELGQQLISLIQWHDNMDDVERIERGMTVEDFMNWVRNVFIKEFQELDAHFRQNQRMWIRTL